MAGAVQWTIDKFWAQLQNLQTQIKQVDAALQADKVRLGSLYSAVRARYDPSADQFIAPLIHQNTVLRLTYLKPIKDKFNQAVAAASKLLKSAGYSTPQLGGLGVVPVVPVVAATLVVGALAAVAIVNRLTESQILRTKAMVAIYGDPSTTPEQKLALSRQMESQIREENKTPPPGGGFNLDSLVPLAGIVALIVLGPQILRMLPGRRATA